MRKRDPWARTALAPRVAACLALACGSEAAATPITAPDLIAFGDARLRWEGVRGGDGTDADATTASARLGVEARLGGGFAALIEAETVGQLTAGADPMAAAIGDAAGAEIHRAQASFTTPAFSATLGRQRIVHDDERFVGAVSFRQNQQSFDAVRLWAARGGFSFEAAHLWRVNAPTGFSPQGHDLRGEALIVRASAPLPAGARVVAFGHALDLADSPTAPPAAQSRTLGVRAEGEVALGQMSAAWGLTHARQTLGDGGDDARYARIEAALHTPRGRARLVQERLGAGAAGFQTPLGSRRNFQGAADVFLTTPPAGVRDTHAEISASFGALGPFDAIGGFARHHWFSAERGGAAYGQEWDLGLSVGFGGVSLSLEHARYRSSGFGEDLDRAWLTIARRF